MPKPKATYEKTLPNTASLYFIFFCLFPRADADNKAQADGQAYADAHGKYTSTNQ
ncbi:hypothetical protein [Flavobacterium sp. UGB4466]|uniref:hypothetical protein n=1 Tax=Flavobacterium sp. UGB4466 TaxID=2730889 RepID=UPI00192AAC97|nr:hypothetical protein [Flavobacterium sp. UGB4466]